MSNGINWYRRAIEKKLIFGQIFNNAKQAIEKEISNIENWGVVLDIDNTVLEDSWYMQDNNKWESGIDFTTKIIRERKSIPTCGAKEFIDFVKKNGGKISLISNRYGDHEDVMKVTALVLDNFDIHFDNIILTNSQIPNHPDKNSRFKSVESGIKDSDMYYYDDKLISHKIIAYLGDSIGDFPKLHRNIIPNYENDLFNKLGKEFFIFPNPLYGGWSS